jgi:TonB family protein
MTDDRIGQPSDAGRPRFEAGRALEEATTRLRTDPAQRRLVVRALVAAIALHATALVARIPDWGPDPVRVDAPAEHQMKVQFLKPPAAPKAPPKPPEPIRKKVPRPDPTPDEPEPIKEAPPPAPPEATATPAPARDLGPIRVSPGQGPGLIKKVEPQYPPIARASRLEGSVVVDAIIRKDGAVSDVKILKSSNALFEQACLEAVRRWQFTPSPNDVILTVTVNFTLR